MTDNTALESARDVLARALGLGPADIPVAGSFDDIAQWDSVSHLQVMLLLEEESGIEINEDTIVQCMTIDGIADVLATK